MDRLWKSDLENGNYKNPVLFADYSDPDVIRVGDTYYMTASSFNYVPGLPILTSKDLVNWELKNYAAMNIPYDKYSIPQHSKGVWAPAIRYHEGRFYIYYGMPDEGIFMVSAKDPLAKWDEPVLVLEGKGLIDSCPFWDEDGKAYIIHGYAKSRIGFKSCLGIFEMSQDGKKAIAEDHILFDGIETQPTIEGPKVYKRDGYYYVLAPAGGVKPGWQTALRSKNIYGPYEEKIVLKQGNTDINGPHQGALVDTVNGDEWFIHFQDLGLYGRVTLLEPVTWTDGWPAMGINIKDACGEPVREYRKPNTGITCTPSYLEASDDFNGSKLNLLWQWMGNYTDDFYSLTKYKGKLSLNAINPAAKLSSEATLPKDLLSSKKMSSPLWERSNVLTQKLVCPKFTASVKVDFSNLSEGGEAGFVMMGGDYAYISVRNEAGKLSVNFVQSHEDNGAKIEEIKYFDEICCDVNKDIIFTITFNNSFLMSYEFDGVNKDIEISKGFMPSDHTWVGAKMGLFANSLTGKDAGSAEFEYIHVEAIDEIN